MFLLRTIFPPPRAVWIVTLPQHILVAYLQCCDFTQLVSGDNALWKSLQLLFKTPHLALQLYTLLHDAVDLIVDFHRQVLDLLVVGFQNIGCLLQLLLFLLYLWRDHRKLVKRAVKYVQLLEDVVHLGFGLVDKLPETLAELKEAICK